MLILAGGIGNPGNLYTEPQQLLIGQEKKLFSDLSHKQSFLKNIVSGYPQGCPRYALICTCTAHTAMIYIKQCIKGTCYVCDYLFLGFMPEQAL